MIPNRSAFIRLTEAPSPHLALTLLACALAWWSRARARGTFPRRVEAALLRGENRAVLKWVEQGGGVDARDRKHGAGGQTLLMLASAAGNDRLVVELLALGASAVAKAEALVDMTPLHFAAVNGHCAVAAALIEAGASLTALTANRLTALDVAERHVNAERQAAKEACAALLRRHGAVRAAEMPRRKARDEGEKAGGGAKRRGAGRGG